MKLILMLSFVLICTGQTENELNFKSDEINLKGWLTKPIGSGPFPAVILIHGSGGFTARNKGFRFLAKYFNTNGIAVYYYEKRGVGGSEGDYEWTSFDELSNDVVSAVDMLKTQKEIKSDQIGVWGISQGGWLGPLAATKSNDIKFVIAASGPAVSPYLQHIFDVGNRNRSNGLNDQEVEESRNLLAKLMDYYGNPNLNTYHQAQTTLEQAKKNEWFKQIDYIELRGVTDSLGLPQRMLELQKKIPGLYFYATGNHYDPIPTLKKLTVPFLAIFGEADKLVDVKRTVPIINSTFEEIGKKNYKIKIFPNASHGITISSFNLTEDPFAPGYMQLMVEWIKENLN